MASLETLPDTELLTLLRAGDHAAYRAIYQRYQTLLYSYAYKKLQDREAAKDLLQEIFLTLWNQREQLDIHTALDSYLYRAVRNRAFDLFARRKTRQQHLDSLQHYLNTSEDTADRLLDAKELNRLIEAEIALMPKGMREVFELSRKHYLSHKEIAQTLGMSEDAVNKQIKRALKQLRLKLGLAVWLLISEQQLLAVPEGRGVAPADPASQRCAPARPGTAQPKPYL